LDVVVRQHATLDLERLVEQGEHLTGRSDVGSGQPCDTNFVAHDNHPPSLALSNAAGLGPIRSRVTAALEQE